MGKEQFENMDMFGLEQYRDVLQGSKPELTGAGKQVLRMVIKEIERRNIAKEESDG